MAEQTPMKEESTYNLGGKFSVSENQMKNESTYQFENSDKWMVRNNPPINEKTEFNYYYANDGKVTITLYPDFLQEPPRNQRKAIRIFIWWAIKQYIKTLLKGKL